MTRSGSPVEMPPELRETRLRLRVDELTVRANKYSEWNNVLRNRLELKNEKIAALQREIRQLVRDVEALERELVRRPL